MVNFFIKIGTFILALLRFAMFILVLITILGFIKPYISNISSYYYVEKVVDFENDMNTKIKDTIPTSVKGYDLSRIITIIALLILIDITRSFSEKLQFQKYKQRMADEIKNIRANYQSQSPSHKEKIDLLQS